MDIADIRKKAKSGKRSALAEPVSAAIRDDQSQRVHEPLPPVVRAEPVPAIAPAVAAAAEPDSAPVVTAVKVEPKRHKKAPAASSLDELFELIPDFDLATEDGYQHGLDHRGKENDEAVRRFLTFSLDQEEYALDIADIREIIKPREITDIPRVPGFLLGIISLRGSIIPVFDLKSRLNLGVGSVTADARIVVCSHDQRTAGLLVDRISQVVTLPAVRIEPAPAVLSGLDRDLVEGVGRHHGKMMILLQMASVLNAELT